MAAIEKICEYSNEYYGGIMYEWKRDHIQICPEFRKDFQHQDAVLFIEPVKEVRIYGRRRYSYWTLEVDTLSDQIFQIGKHHYDARSPAHPVSIRPEYCYALYVPGKPGIVDGVYYNQTSNISAVKRKLTRMLRCKKLKVVRVDDIFNYFEHNTVDLCV